MARKDTREPDFQQACKWWRDLPNTWTPIGWPDHLARFNVLWNGSILAQPHLNRRTEQWQGQGLYLAIVPHYTEYHNDWASSFLRHDDGMVKQGWCPGDAPRLWSEWSKDGVLVRSEIFAHTPGGGPLQRGDEPLFAWVRFRLHALCPALPLEDSYGVNLILHAPHLSTSMSMRDNIRFWADQAKYPRELKPARAGYSAAKGWLLLEPGAKVRLAVPPGQVDLQQLLFLPPVEKQPWTKLHLRLPCRQDASVDLLVPLLPTARQEAEKELARGYDAALAEADRFWQAQVQSETRFEVPEPELNEAIRHSVRFSHVLTERNPATGKLCKINGSWTYANLWTTPGAMDLTMMMDLLGQHRMVRRYLDIFRDEQGTVVPPGAAYELHPGYLSTPAAYKSIDWLSDNGAVLYVLAEHALLSGDAEYAKEFADTIVKSCDWIKAARAKTGHGGYEGVLPPAVATDAGTKIQAVWTVGWNYKGLCSAVRLLKQLGHPRAVEFEAEAKDYRSAFLDALRDKCQKMPTWTDADGKARRFVPTSLAGDNKAESRHAFYLDTGPLFPVFAGLMDADDPLMKDVRAWFRHGPQHAFYRRDANCWQVPVLDKEMSSCEPCYSWNVFHSWQLGNRQRFLEGMYSLFAGSLSRQTWISCETRGGITGNVFSAPLGIYLARLAVVDDQLEDDTLHLLRLAPLAWLRPGAACRFEQLPTGFGPVTLRTAMSDDGKTLTVDWQPAFRQTPKRVLLHRPPLDDLKHLVVNGQDLGKGKKPVRLSQ